MQRSACMTCGKVRVKRGEQPQPESGNTSHALCPDCFMEFYKDEYTEEEMRAEVQEQQQIEETADQHWVEDPFKEHDKEVKQELNKK